MTTAISALAFRTGIVPGTVGQVTADTVTFSVAADGSLFSMDGSSLYYHDPVNGMTSVASVSSSAGFMAQVLAAMSRGQVYCIGWSSAQQLAVMEWTTDGGITALAALPEGVTPQSVSVAADGTLWAAGSDGKPYSYANSEWTAFTAPPGAIQMLSAGNATFGIALVAQDVPQAMLYQNGSRPTRTTTCWRWSACPATPRSSPPRSSRSSSARSSTR